MNKTNMGKLYEAWSPMIQTTTGITDPVKVKWMAELAHNQSMHSMNESAMGGVSMPYNTLYNTVGIGNPVPAQQAGMTGAQQMSKQVIGSGDKWNSVVSLALQVAARTVGFDLVNTTPFAGPTGVLPFMDYVYAGSKQPYGAQPAYNPATANPDGSVGNWNPAFSAFETPHAFKVNLRGLTDVSLGELIPPAGTTVTTVTFSNGTQDVVTEYIDRSRIDGFQMFKVVSVTPGANLGMVFNGTTTVQIGTGTESADHELFPQLISMLENQIKGFTGSGPRDQDPWTGTFVNAQSIYEPMERGTGEMQWARQLSLAVHTKWVSVGTEQVAVGVTQEQVTDLQKQWGIDVLKMVENAAINELSQSINKNITSRLFSLGWLNHSNAYDVEGMNVNMDLTSATPGATFTAAAPADPTATAGGSGVNLITMPLVPFQTIPSIGQSFENQDTIIRRIATNLLLAGNIVTQRGRRGPATFVVTNLKIATLLQSNAQYGFAPIANTINQTNGSLYPIGTIAGMTVYVDPLMQYDDTRVLVGRKGNADEPGVHFCPYLMAESVRIIAEGTMSPKVLLKSRYALVNVGWFPETQYLTFYVKTGAGIL